jgi:predicted HicB family RNase H-like nuclease
VALVFSEAILSADPQTEGFAGDFVALQARARAQGDAQKGLRHDALRAQAKIDYLNNSLDALTKALVLQLIAVYGARDAAGFRQY